MASPPRRQSSRWLKSVELTALDTAYFWASDVASNADHSVTTWPYVSKVSTLEKTDQYGHLVPDGYVLFFQMSNGTDPLGNYGYAQEWDGSYGQGDSIVIQPSTMDHMHSSTDPKAEAKKIEKFLNPDGMNPTALPDKTPALTNFSGVWAFDSKESKVTNGGMAYGTMGLSSKDASVGIGIINHKPGGFAIVGVYKTPERILVTPSLKLPKGDSFCFEIDIDRKSGQTNLWINDEGLNLGILKGFENGAHGAALALGAVRYGDHLLSGRFTDCALAVDGQWQQACVMATQKDSKILPHHEVGIIASNGMYARDLRTAVI